MDRVTVYSQELPRTVDFLQADQNTMVSIGKVLECLIGTGSFVAGLACTPNSPAALNVLLAGGQVFQVESLEATSWSLLGSDTTDQIVKQGIQLAQQTISLTPPGTGGFSQVFLIEAQYSDLDTGSTVLPYYNAANPAAPFSGPGNAGTPQNTTRKGTVQVQVKAGTAAATGTQIAPSADAGWIGLWQITVANGATTITSGNIVQVPNAPFIGASYLPKLPTVPAYVQSGAPVYCVDTGSTNALAVAPVPVPSALVAGMQLRVKVANTVSGASTLQVTLSSGNVNNNIVHSDSSAIVASDIVANQVISLTYDGTNWQTQGISQQVTPSGVEASFPGLVAPSGWLMEFGQAISRTTNVGLFTALSQTVTGTPATGNATITAVGTNLVGTGVEGAFIEGTGISTGTTISSVTSTTIVMSANAIGGTAGETLRIIPFGQGDGSTTFNVPDRRGRFLAGRDNMGGTAANRLTGVTGSIAGTKLNATGGEETHVLSIAELATHTPTISSATLNGTASINMQSQNNLAIGGSVQGFSWTGSGAETMANAPVSVTINSIGSSSAHNNVPPSAMTNWIIKT